MKKTLLALSVLALFTTVAMAEIGISKTAVEAARQNGVTQQQSKGPLAGVPAACNPCVWYSGDLDPSNPNADGLFNSNAEYFGVESQIWVPMVVGSDGDPAHGHVRINSVTFNELLLDNLGCGGCDYAGSTYDLRIKVGPGEAGTVKASGPCPQSPTPVATGTTAFGDTEYSYTCLAPAQPKTGAYFLIVPVQTLFWINVTPAFTSGDYAYLSDVEDVPSPNQLGWSDDFYNSFWYSSYFGANFANTQTTNGGGCGGIGCDMFSVAVGGFYVK